MEKSVFLILKMSKQGGSTSSVCILRELGFLPMKQEGKWNIPI